MHVKTTNDVHSNKNQLVDLKKTKLVHSKKTICFVLTAQVFFEFAAYSRPYFLVRSVLFCVVGVGNVDCDVGEDILTKVVARRARILNFP